MLRDLRSRTEATAQPHRHGAGHGTAHTPLSMGTAAPGPWAPLPPSASTALGPSTAARHGTAQHSMAWQGLTLHGFGHLQAVQPVLICHGLAAVPGSSVCLILAQRLCRAEGTGQPEPSLPVAWAVQGHPRRDVTSPAWEPGPGVGHSSPRARKGHGAGLTLQGPCAVLRGHKSPFLCTKGHIPMQGTRWWGALPI